MTRVVSGNADTLRRLAEAVEAGDESALDAAAADAEIRIEAFKAKHPGVVAADLVGRVFCGATGPIWWGSTTPPPTYNATGTTDTLGAEIDTVRRPLAAVVDGDEAEMWIYGDIDSWGWPWGVSAEEFIAELEQVTAPRLTLHVNSYGGEVFEGMAIRTGLQRHPAQVTVTVDAIAASIASVVAMAGDSVVMSDPSMLMIHDAWGVAIGDAIEMRKMADLLDKISDQIAGVYAGKAGGDTADWRKAMLAETWYGADEAVEAGLADAVDRTATGDGDDAASDDGAPAAGAVLRVAARATKTPDAISASTAPAPAASDLDPDQPDDPDGDTPEPASGEPDDDESADDWAHTTAALLTPQIDEFQHLTEALLR